MYYTILIFVLILFLYIHITAQWKTSDDLEIYEADYKSPAQMQEICSVKQPVLFKIEDPEATRVFDRMQVAKMEKYDNIDVHVKDIADYYSVSDDPAIDFISLPLRSAHTLLSSDSKSKYFSETNDVFIEESGLDSIVQSLDGFLKPGLTAYRKYDLVFGSPHVSTPLRYHVTSQQFLSVTSGKIRVKMCPPKYRKVLPLIKDYENYEFRTPINVFDPGAKTSKSSREIFDKVKFLDFEVHAGSTLFIPPYWWYAIQFSGDANTTVLVCTYDQVMNVFAQSNHWLMYFLQQANITTRVSNLKTEMFQGKDADDEDTHDEYTDKEPASEIQPPQPPKEIVTNAGTYVTSG